MILRCTRCTPKSKYLWFRQFRHVVEIITNFPKNIAILGGGRPQFSVKPSWVWWLSSVTPKHLASIISAKIVPVGSVVEYPRICMVKNAVCPGEWCLAVCSIPQKTVTVSGSAWSIGWVYSAGKKTLPDIEQYFDIHQASKENIFL